MISNTAATFTREFEAAKKSHLYFRLKSNTGLELAGESF